MKAKKTYPTFTTTTAKTIGISRRALPMLVLAGFFSSGPSAHAALSCGDTAIHEEITASNNSSSQLDANSQFMQGYIQYVETGVVANVLGEGDCPSECPERSETQSVLGMGGIVNAGSTYTRHVKSTIVVTCTPTPKPGCTDVAASNYDSSATYEDGSCLYWVYGCTDTGATNYNPYANLNDGSCNYDFYGCTDILATNYNSYATINDGSCSYAEVCTDPLALNYNSTGSCTYE